MFLLGLKKNDTVDFYYIHSFYVVPYDKNIISIDSDGFITTAIKSNNIYGCQFHPEKSHVHGLNILSAFNNLNSDISK